MLLDSIIGGSLAPPGSTWRQLGLCLALDMAVQWSLSIFAILLQTERFYDLAGASTHVLLSFATLQAVSFSPELGRGTMLTLMVAAWGLRLSSYLFLRILKDGKDRRFNVARKTCGGGRGAGLGAGGGGGGGGVACRGVA